MPQPNRQQRQKKQKAPTAPPNRLDILYTKSNACRVVHADGAYGGVTPTLDIYMALYSQHNATPEGTTLRFDHAAKTAREEIHKPRHQWVREIESEVIMSRDTARSLRDWLNGRLDVADKMDSDSDIVFTTEAESTGGRYADSSN